jgi:uncharacterized protein (TIGR04255 family)
MSEWVFEDPNPITSYNLGVELAAPIAPARLREISALHVNFRRDLPRKVEQPMLTFQMAALPGARPQAQLGNVTFDSVRENGTVARALSIGPSQIAYMTASYPRWEEFEPVATRHISEIAKLTMSESRVAAIVMGVTNQFTWAGDAAENDIGKLLNPGSHYVAPNMLSCRDHCHSFHGYLEKLSSPDNAQRIANINVQTGDLPEGKRTVSIVFIHRTILAAPVGDFEVVFGSPSSETPQAFGISAREMRRLNNRLLCDIISPSISAKIPGLRP